MKNSGHKIRIRFVSTAILMMLVVINQKNVIAKTPPKKTIVTATATGSWTTEEHPAHLDFSHLAKPLPYTNGTYADKGMPNPYVAKAPTNEWAKLPEGAYWASIVGVSADSKGDVYVLHRCFGDNCYERPEPSILVFDGEGDFLRSFGAGLFVRPHGLWIDGKDNVWAADVETRGHVGFQIHKFDRKGNLLESMGRKGYSAKTGLDYFVEPNHVITSAEGDIFVAEGHNDLGWPAVQNADKPYTKAASPHRILRLDSAGRFKNIIGGPGSVPGKFNVPHAIAFDSKGRLFVADRGNSSIQIFEQDGTFVAEWKQFGRPSTIHIDKNDKLYVTDIDSSRNNNLGFRYGIWVGDAATGERCAFIPSTINEPGGPEALWVDDHGDIYAGSVFRTLTRYFKDDVTKFACN